MYRHTLVKLDEFSEIAFGLCRLIMTIMLSKDPSLGVLLNIHKIEIRSKVQTYHIKCSTKLILLDSENVSWIIDLGDLIFKYTYREYAY